MRYIIESDGKVFRLKINKGLFWIYEKQYCHTGCFETPVLSYRRDFKSEIEVEKYVKETYGNYVERVRKFKII